MLHFSFENFGLEGLFFEARSVFFGKASLKNIATFSELREGPPKKEKKKVEKKEPPPQEEKPVPVPLLKPELKKRPRKAPRTRRQLDSLRQKREKEKFEVYAEHIKMIDKKFKEAIETPSGDKLYEFILQFDRINKNARGYGDKGNTYREWNKAFCEHFGLKPIGKETVKSSYAHYAYALQLYLKREFPKMVKSADSLFLDFPRKKGVRYVYYDGKIGGYTMSVLGEYWNHKYFEKRKDKKKKKLGRACLGKEFAKNTKLQKSFEGAMAHLDGQLKGELVAKKTVKAKEKSKLSTEDWEKLREQLRKDKKSNEAYLAAAKEFMEKHGIKDKDIEGKNWSKGKLDEFRKDYFGGLDDKVYKELALGAGVTVEVTPSPASVVQEGAAPEPTVTVLAKPPQVIEIKDLPSAIQPSLKTLLTNAIDGRKKKRLRERKPFMDELLTNNDSEINEFRRGGIDEEWDINVNENKYTRPGSWPRKAYILYEKAYKKWKKANKAFSTIDTSKFRTPEEKKKKEAKLEKLRKTERDALDDLEIAIKEYYAEEDRVYDALDAELRQKLIAEAAKYKFHPDTDLSKIYSFYEFSNWHPLVRTLRDSLPSFRPFPKIRGGPARDYEWKILSTFLKEMPTKPFKEGDYETFRKALKDEHKEDLEKTFDVIKKRGGKVDPIEVFNTIFYINNLNQFAEAARKLGEEWYPGQAASRLSPVNQRSLAAMLAEKKKEKGATVASSGTR